MRDLSDEKQCNTIAKTLAAVIDDAYVGWMVEKTGADTLDEEDRKGGVTRVIRDAVRDFVTRKPG